MTVATWGTGSFENDDAMDWLADLLAGDASLVPGTLGRAGGDFVDAADAACAVAAAEIVAACAGAPAEGLPQAAADWAARHRSDATPELIQTARDRVARVAADSELADLWTEAGDEAWRRNVAALVERLDAAAADRT